jgi:hypothetical protein
MVYVQEHGSSPDISPYRQLGFPTYAMLYDTLTVIECMWRAKEVLMRPTLTYKNAVGEVCSGIACSCGAVTTSAPTPAPAPVGVAAEGSEAKGSSSGMDIDADSSSGGKAPSTATSAAPPEDAYAHIHGELCPYHSELASVLSYRLPRRKCIFTHRLSFLAPIAHASHIYLCITLLHDYGPIDSLLLVDWRARRAAAEARGHLRPVQPDIHTPTGRYSIPAGDSQGLCAARTDRRWV